jgi:methylmalonyl-CoA/ethylmalonyl-CoA epimerase
VYYGYDEYRIPTIPLDAPGRTRTTEEEEAMMNTPSVDHIGIAVRTLDEASALFSKILGMSESHRERVESEGVELSVFEIGGARIELLAPTRPDSPVSRFLDRRGAGIHHIALRLDDVRSHHDRLVERGFRVLGSVRKGGEGREVFFLDPKETSGVLFEFTSPPDR